MISKEFVQEIVTKNNLSGKWREGWGALPYEFVVDGNPPPLCPNCQKPLIEDSVSYSDGETDYDDFKSCDPCGLIWWIEDEG